MKRLYSIFTLIFLIAEFVSAQVTLKIQAPSQTEVGRRIRISYVANTQDVEDIHVGEFPGFNVIYGPSTSSSSSFSINHGKTAGATCTWSIYNFETWKFAYLDIFYILCVSDKAYSYPSANFCLRWRLNL